MKKDEEAQKTKNKKNEKGSSADEERAGVENGKATSWNALLLQRVSKPSCGFAFGSSLFAALHCIVCSPLVLILAAQCAVAVLVELLEDGEARDELVELADRARLEDALLLGLLRQSVSAAL